MRRTRAFISSLAMLSLLMVTLAAPVEAARPEPWVTRLVATTGWVTDTEGGQSWYVLWIDAYARDAHWRQHVVCVKVTYSDGSRLVNEGSFPRVARGAEASTWLQFGAIPEGVTAITVTAQMMRIGARGCCMPVGTLRTVEATLPVRPTPPPALSDPQIVFDVSFPAP